MSAITELSPSSGGCYPPPAELTGAPENRALSILLEDARAGRPVHVEHIPARAGHQVPWPAWAPAEITDAFARRGIAAPWSHQAAAASHAEAGRNVIISTGAASGKSLGYLLPALTSVLAGDTVPCQLLHEAPALLPTQAFGGSVDAHAPLTGVSGTGGRGRRAAVRRRKPLPTPDTR